MNDKTGFSLLELLVVLVIMGVAASLVGIRISGSMDQVQVMAASGKIAASLKWARTKAITERAVYLASIYIEDNRISVQRQKMSEIEDDIGSDVENDPGQSRHRTLSYQLPDGLSFVKGISIKNEKYTDLFEIEFYPSGNSSGGEIFLSDKAENLSRIRVNFITGIVEVDERLADSG
ncbi:prepilin-type N-terminal cleavage/methylation domain-containing protein [Desulfobacterales bacterium HSG16]|nr:prepilin-type N-terminal cleavage/methylation domain-containing protein [Desulfobacterales bacterium HSG16]